jgi:hypothetical protein
METSYDLENTKNRRSACGSGNQHVRMCGAEVTVAGVPTLKKWKLVVCSERLVLSATVLPPFLMSIDPSAAGVGAVLCGAAAGGGIPQWSRGCTVCVGAREGGTVSVDSQISIAVSVDLINAAPELRQQLIARPRLHARPGQNRQARSGKMGARPLTPTSISSRPVTPVSLGSKSRLARPHERLGGIVAKPGMILRGEAPHLREAPFECHFADGQSVLRQRQLRVDRF